jgi:hypothetical protein
MAMATAIEMVTGTAMTMETAMAMVTGGAMTMATVTKTKWRL